MAFADLPRGKLPPKRPYRDVRVKLASYLHLPRPPATKGWAEGVRFRMYLNDKLGDCAVASLGHMQQVHTRRDGHEIDPTNSQILRAFRETGIEQNLGDQDGRVMQDVLKHFRTKPSFAPILGYAAVNPQNLAEVKAAMFAFGGIHIGTLLPERAGYQWDAGQPWSTQPGPGSLEPGTWGGHAMYCCAYGWSYVTAVTWGQRQQLTWAFLRRYCDEAYCVVSEAWADPDKLAPSGVDRERLLADLGAL